MRFAAVVILVFSVFPLHARAQTSATLAGRVNDSTGGVVPGATITARHLERSIERIAVKQLHMVAPGPDEASVIERVLPASPPPHSAVALR